VGRGGKKSPKGGGGAVLRGGGGRVLRWSPGVWSKEECMWGETRQEFEEIEKGARWSDLW